MIETVHLATSSWIENFGAGAQGRAQGAPEINPKTQYIKFSKQYTPVLDSILNDPRFLAKCRYTIYARTDIRKNENHAESAVIGLIPIQHIIFYFAHIRTLRGTTLSAVEIVHRLPNQCSQGLPTM